MKTLRLLLTEECDRNCPKCCNKKFNLKSLPVCKDYTKFDQCCITGGEPMLKPGLIKSVTQIIKSKKWMPIYLYTAKIDNIEATLSVLFFLDGITLTLHEQKDVEKFTYFNALLPSRINKSLRLNIFKGIKIPNQDYGKWKIKENITWQENCPLPKNETFMRFI